MKSSVKHGSTTTPESPHDEHIWLANLVRELFQTEQSAARHPRIEVERLGDVPPAQVLRAVAAHADSALSELPTLVKQYGLPVSLGGRAVGSAFSMIRNQLTDLFFTLERSFRGTLLGMRHGVDLVTLVEQVARRDGATALADWCLMWLERRRALVADAERALAWFADHPEAAQKAARRRPLAMGLQALVSGLEHASDRWRRPSAPARSS